MRAAAPSEVVSFHRVKPSLRTRGWAKDERCRVYAKYTRLENARGSDYAWAAAGVPHMEGHASWVDAYYPAGLKVGALPPLYEWLLQHRRTPGPAPGPSR